MKPLWKGIYSKFTSSTSAAFYTDMRGQLYLTQTPQNTTTPYAVFDVISHTHDWDMDGRDWETCEVQFNIMDSQGASDIGKMFDDLNTMFDGQELSSTGYSTIFINRNWCQMVYHSGEVSGKHIWQYTVTFDVSMKQT